MSGSWTPAATCLLEREGASRRAPASGKESIIGVVEHAYASNPSLIVNELRQIAGKDQEVVQAGRGRQEVIFPREFVAIIKKGEPGYRGSAVKGGLSR